MPSFLVVSIYAHAQARIVEAEDADAACVLAEESEGEWQDRSDDYDVLANAGASTFEEALALAKSRFEEEVKNVE